MIILPPCIADFNILFNETAFFLQRYFIRFDRLILLSRVVHIATHVSTVTSCIELWFPTSASVASPPFFFFLSFSPSLVLFLSLLRVFFSSSSSFFFSFFFISFFFLCRGVIMRQRWSNFVASRLLRNWSRRRLRSRSVIFKHSVRNDVNWFAKAMVFLLSLFSFLTILRLFRFVTFFLSFFLLFLWFFFFFLLINWFELDTLRICDKVCS